MGEPFVFRAGRFIRDAWLVVGVAVLMFVGAELLYRAQAAARQGLASTPELERPPHPYDGESWWAEWQGGDAKWDMRFDPYRGLWARPGESKYINIDTLGRRVTFDPAPGVPKRATVYMFGGSAMFGYTSRDRYTIPSLVAEELARRGYPDVSVVNYAQSTFNLTQEVNTLVLELRARRIPAVAVFMDGNNEVAPPFQSGRVGSILNEDQLASRLVGPRPGLADVLLDRLELVQRLRRLYQTPVEPFLGDERLCPDVAEQYVALTDVARGLGATFRFNTVFFWQPMYATTGKRPTEWERSITSAPKWRSTVVACTKAVDDLVRARGMDNYYPLHHLFDDENASIFIDDYGHVIERANAEIASAVVDRIVGDLPAVSGR